MSNKYPKEIYKAFQDVYGSDFTKAEIDASPSKEVRDIASQGLDGGKKEFDTLVNSRKSMSVIDRLSKRMAQKACEEWKCNCGKHNPNEFVNCEKCGKIKSNENATKELKSQVELTDVGVPLDHVLGTVAQHFPEDFKISIDNIDELIDEIRKIVSRPSSDGGG